MYRQGFAEVNSRKKLGLPANSPNTGRGTFPLSVGGYCNQTLDLMHLETQWEAWVRLSAFSRVSYPILAIQFEHMWNHLPELFRFVNLPETFVPSFPRKRMRKSLGGEQPRNRGCSAIYEPLSRKIRNTSQLLVIWDGNTYTDMDSFFAAYTDPPLHSPEQSCTSTAAWDGGPAHYHLHILILCLKNDQRLYVIPYC